MNPLWKGRLFLLVICLFAAGWVLHSVRSQAMLEMRLQEAEARLQETLLNQAASARSMEEAIQAREKALKEFNNKRKELDDALGENSYWNDISVPDDVARLLNSGAAEIRLCPAGTSASGH